jgi:hypothetical protein
MYMSVRALEPHPSTPHRARHAVRGMPPVVWAQRLLCLRQIGFLDAKPGLGSQRNQETRVEAG